MEIKDSSIFSDHGKAIFSGSQTSEVSMGNPDTAEEKKSQIETKKQEISFLQLDPPILESTRNTQNKQTSKIYVSQARIKRWTWGSNCTFCKKQSLSSSDKFKAIKKK